jgi:hypothetical protein
MSQKGGLRTSKGCPGKDLSIGHSRHSMASAEYRSPPTTDIPRGDAQRVQQADIAPSEIGFVQTAHPGRRHSHSVSTSSGWTQGSRMNSPRLSPQTNAALLRLQHADDYLVNDILRELLDSGEGLNQVASIVEAKLDERVHILYETLSTLIAITKSKRLYEKKKDDLLRDNTASLVLYKSGYPDPEIEKKLCDRLYKIFSDDAEPWRRIITEAMCDVGTVQVLPTLEAILFDLKSTAQVKQIFANALVNSSEEPTVLATAAIYGLEASSRASFVELLTLSIDAIKQRGITLALPSQSSSFGDAEEASRIAKLISGGESESVEFKATLRRNLLTGQVDDKIHMAVLKTIAAFLNTEGGTLLIGVADDGSIRGLSDDGFADEDTMTRHLVNLIRDRIIGATFFPYVHPEFVTHDGGRVLLVRCERGAKPAFVKEGNTEKFYVRAANTSIELPASSIRDYCSNKFK